MVLATAGGSRPALPVSRSADQAWPVSHLRPAAALRLPREVAGRWSLSSGPARGQADAMPWAKSTVLPCYQTRRASSRLRAGNLAVAGRPQSTRHCRPHAQAPYLEV
jgi:hypothetical protein